MVLLVSIVLRTVVIELYYKPANGDGTSIGDGNSGGVVGCAPQKEIGSGSDESLGYLLLDRKAACSSFCLAAGVRGNERTSFPLLERPAIEVLQCTYCMLL